MKVLLVSTSDKRGGAAIACYRLYKALQKNGVDVNMLVREKDTNDDSVTTVNTSLVRKLVNWLSFVAERVQIFLNLKFRKKYLFKVSLDNYGAMGLLNHPLVKEADVINFHWTSQAMLSLKQLQTLLNQGKKIVFTMHDMHYFTGICHYSRECYNYREGCGKCLFLNSNRSNDISHRRYEKKLNIKNRYNLRFVACSKWLSDIAKTSLMFQQIPVTDIPNPIDTEVFKRINREEARKKLGITGKFVLVYGAVSVLDRRKGFVYLQRALNYIHEQYPEFDSQIELLIFGSVNQNLISTLPYPYKLVGYLSDDKDLVTVYSAADIYVTPSLDDNLPNTVMEALSCSIPCVAFNVGGLSQLIDNHINGYLANYKDYKDFGNGIVELLNNEDKCSLRHSARKKVEENFSETVVALRYLEEYRTSFIQF